MGQKTAPPAVFANPLICGNLYPEDIKMYEVSPMPSSWQSSNGSNLHVPSIPARGLYGPYELGIALLLTVGSITPTGGHTASAVFDRFTSVSVSAWSNPNEQFTFGGYAYVGVLKEDPSSLALVINAANKDIHICYKLA